MTHIAGKASKDDSPILHAAIRLASQIRAASEEIEHGRRIPPPLAAAIKEAGIFGMVMPRAWGGPELDPMMQCRVIEALAMEDGSVGWCAMINQRSRATPTRAGTASGRAIDGRSMYRSISERAAAARASGAPCTRRYSRSCGFRASTTSSPASACRIPRASLFTIWL